MSNEWSQSDVRGNKRIETKFLDWDTELGKLSFIGLYHVRVSLSNFLKLSLNLTDSFILELLDFFESAANHSKSLRVNTGSWQDLISLSILCLKTLLNSLNLLLKDQVTETSLSMHIIYNTMEFFEKLFLFLFNVLVLLVQNFILPFNIMVFFLGLHDLLLLLSQHISYLIVLYPLVCQASYFFLNLFEWTYDSFIVRVLNHFFTVSLSFSNLFRFKISS